MQLRTWIFLPLDENVTVLYWLMLYGTNIYLLGLVWAEGFGARENQGPSSPRPGSLGPGSPTFAVPAGVWAGGMDEGTAGSSDDVEPPTAEPKSCVSSEAAESADDHKDEESVAESSAASKGEVEEEEAEAEIMSSNDIVDPLQAQHDAIADAEAAEHAAVAAIEVAMISHQQLVAQQEALVRARKAAANAVAASKAAETSMEAAVKHAAETLRAADAAKAAHQKAADHRKEADEVAERAVMEMEANTAAAAKEAAELEAELKAAASVKARTMREANHAADKARADATEAKWAKREMDRTALAASDAANATAAALTTIADREHLLNQKVENATQLNRVAYELKSELEEAEEAVERCQSPNLMASMHAS